MKIIDPKWFPNTIPILKIKTNSWGVECFHSHIVFIQPFLVIQLIKHSFNKNMIAYTVHSAKSEWYNFGRYNLAPTLMEDIFIRKQQTPHHLLLLFCHHLLAWLLHVSITKYLRYSSLLCSSSISLLHLFLEYLLLLPLCLHIFLTIPLNFILPFCCNQVCSNQVWSKLKIIGNALLSSSKPLDFGINCQKFLLTKHSILKFPTSMIILR